MKQTLPRAACLCRFAAAFFFFTSCAAVGAFAQESGRGSAKYIGAGSCSATACHGGVQPRTITSVLQNEYSVWVVQDSHAKAYRSLQNPVSLRMGRILGIGKPEGAPK